MTHYFYTCEYSWELQLVSAWTPMREEAMYYRVGAEKNYYTHSSSNTAPII